MAGFAAIALGLSDAMEREHREQHEAEIQTKKTLIDAYFKLMEKPSLGEQSRIEAFRSGMYIAQLPSGKMPTGVHKDITHVFQPPKPSAEAQAPQQVPLPPGMMGGGEEVPTAPGMLRANELPPPPPAISAPPQTMSFTPPAPPSYGGTVERGWGFIPPEEISAMQRQAAVEKAEALLPIQARHAKEAITAQAEGKLEIAKRLRAQFPNISEEDSLIMAGLKEPRPEPQPPSLQHVFGTYDGKPVVAAWNPQKGALTVNGIPIDPTKFVQGTPGSKDFIDRVQEAKTRQKQGKATEEDLVVIGMWDEQHRPPQAPPPIYVAGLGLVDRTGKLVARIDVPTSTTRTMVEKAPKVLGFIDRLMPQISAQAQQLGPGTGRWNTLWTTDVGVSNPGFHKLKVNTSLLSTLLMQMHVGARGTEYILQSFKEMIDAGKQSPDNLLAGKSVV